MTDEKPVLTPERQAKVDDATVVSAMAGARKAAAEADSAEITASTARLKASIGEVPAGPYTGSATVGEGGCLAEINILARKAVEALAADISARVKKALQGRSAVVLSASGALPDLSHTRALDSRIRLLRSAVDDATAISSNADGVAITPQKVGSNNFWGGLAGAGLVISGISGILGYIKQDFTLGGSSISIPDRDILLLVASKLNIPRGNILIDSFFPPSTQAARDSILINIQTLENDIANLKLLADGHTMWIAKNTLLAENETAVATKEKHERALAACNGAISSFDSLKALLVSDINGVSFFERCAREDTLIEILGTEAVSVDIKMDGIWGSYITKKGLLSGFGEKIPVQVGSSAAASWAIFDVSNGRMLDCDVSVAHQKLRDIADV